MAINGEEDVMAIRLNSFSPAILGAHYPTPYEPRVSGNRSGTYFW